MSADVRFPDLETEGKDARRMSGSVVNLISARESGKSNDKSQILVEIGNWFLQTSGPRIQYFKTETRQSRGEVVQTSKHLSAFRENICSAQKPSWNGSLTSLL